MSNYPILSIEGVGKTFAEKLIAAGVKNTETLLEQAKDPKGRKALAAATGIEESKILKWANMCDLMRIKGVAEEYSELLEAAGVDTIKELRNRKPENLYAKMVEVNEAKKLVRLVPSEKSVIGWVEQAKSLEPKMTY